MRHLTLEELDSLWASVEASIDGTPEIDPWCTGLDWILPVNTSFAPDQERLLLASDDPVGFALLGRYHSSGGNPMWGGLEPLWGFGAPMFGPDMTALTERLADHLAARDADDWRILFLPGMPAPIGEDGRTTTITLDVSTALSALGRVRLGGGITRQVADLGRESGGYDGWLARRSAKFRRNLRQTASRGVDAGVVIEDVADEADVFDRLMTIEHRSWKGQEGSGITGEEMSSMYTTMIDRLKARERLHAHVATVDGADVGYILGGVRARRYRGLQISYVDGAAKLSIGNLLQDHQLRRLSDQDLADTYDLGMDFDYKRRWADRAEASVTIILNRQ